jgi:hypothetical protein
MASEPQEIVSGKNVAARSPEVDFAVVLSRVIESIENDPAQLRNAVYELARIKLRREAWRRDPPIKLWEARHLTLALESAIERVETIYSIVNQAPAQTSDADHLPVFLTRAKGASLNVERSLHWPGAAPLLRGALVAIFAVALCAALSQSGLLGTQAPQEAARPRSRKTRVRNRSQLSKRLNRLSSRQRLPCRNPRHSRSRPSTAFMPSAAANSTNWRPWPAECPTKGFSCRRRSGQ